MINTGIIAFSVHPREMSYTREKLLFCAKKEFHFENKIS